MVLPCGSIGLALTRKALALPAFYCSKNGLVFFTALDISLTFVRQLHSQVDVFLKRWAGLPRPASTAILFSGRSERAGLKITQLVTFWKQMQAVRMDILKHSKNAL